MEKYDFNLSDKLVFFVLTPLAILIALIKLWPNMLDFKNKVTKMNRWLLIMILVLNMGRCILESVDLYVLEPKEFDGNEDETDNEYCAISGGFQILLFDMA